MKWYLGITIILFIIDMIGAGTNPDRYRIETIIYGGMALWGIINFVRLYGSH